ncbi:peptidase S8/S53 domain-containing protein [Xylaria intraflava]|nr:peptidase S8/S53 domain-containing protein [Xylaria intraflava]
MSPVTFSIVGGERVSQGHPIYIYCSEAVKSAQSAVTILRDGNQVDVLVSLSDDDKTIEIPTAGLALGRYNLMVNELLKKQSPGRLTNFYTIVEFIVIEQPSWTTSVPPNLQVCHVVDILVAETETRKLQPGDKIAPEARHLQRAKAIDPETGKIHYFAFENDKQVDFKPILDKVEERQFQKSGRIHETLQRYLASEIPNAPPGDEVNVVVWPHMKDIPLYDKSQGKPSQEYLDAHRRILDTKPGIVAQIAELGGRVTFSPENLHFIHATVPVSKIQELSQSINVGGVFYDDQTAKNDLGNSIAIAGSDLVMQQGHTAKDVRIAVYEGGPSNTKNLQFAGSYSTSPPDSDHARLTSAIIKNVESGGPQGHARDCSLYSANSFDLKALAWALEPSQHCTVVSQSFHREVGPVSGYIQADDILKDYYATQTPFPTIVQSAGNYYSGDESGINPPSNQYVNHKGYNGLTVGNHDDSAMGMAGDSTFRNPISTSGDRELPELAANGTAVASNEQLMSGTSFSAAAVAGVVGLIQGANTVLQTYPEACRAILLASAKRSVAGGTWWGDVAAGVDAKTGAGALDAPTALNIASNYVEDSKPTVSGWAKASISASKDSGEGVKETFIVQVPAAPSSAASTTAFVVKAAIAWNSRVKSEDTKPVSSVLELDLDLIVRDSNDKIVAYAMSFDNSYEVVEFYADPGTTYKLEVVHSSGVGYTWIGTAWTVRLVDWLLKRP